jgi:hypothetical protein
MTGTQQDDIQAQLNAASASSEVDAQLAAMKAEIASSAPQEALPASAAPASDAAAAPATDSAAAPAAEAGDIAEGSVVESSGGQS